MFGSTRIIPFVVILQVGSNLIGTQPKDRSVSAVVSEFRHAIAHEDFNALAKVTRFPIKSNEFGNVKDINVLKSKFKSIFTKERLGGLVDQKPVPLLNGVYAITSKDNTDPIQFLFKKFDGEYKFYSIDNVNE